MIETFLTENMVTRGEPALADYLRSGQSDFSSLRFEALTDLITDLIDSGFNVKRLCKRLSLQTSVTKTAAYTGALSDEDYAQRMRLVIDVTDITDNAVFTLQGTDDDGTNYYDISLIDDSNNSATTKTISAEATGNDANSYIITRPYKKYRLKLVSIGTTITYSAYMIEEIYTTLHRDKTRSNIYQSLMAEQGDVWEGKYRQYLDKYEQRLSSARFIIDNDDDGTISQAEGDMDIATNIVFRP